MGLLIAVLVVVAIVLGISSLSAHMTRKQRKREFGHWSCVLLGDDQDPANLCEPVAPEILIDRKIEHAALMKTFINQYKTPFADADGCFGCTKTTDHNFRFRSVNGKESFAGRMRFDADPIVLLKEIPRRRNSTPRPINLREYYIDLSQP